MRRWGIAILLALTGCSGTAERHDPPDPPRSTQRSGSLRTIHRAPVPARTAHVAVWTGGEMLVWGGMGAPGRAGSPYYEPLADGAAYDPETDTWRTMAPSPLAARTSQNAVWTGSVLLIWGGENGSRKLKDGAAYDPAHDTWTTLPDAPGTRTGAQTAWTGTEALFYGGSSKGGVAYNPATRTWRTLPGAPIPHSYDWAQSTWTGEEFLLFTETTGTPETPAAAYDPAHDTWRKLPNGHIAAGSASGVVWTGDRAVVFSTSSERLDGGKTNPWPRPLDPGGAYLPKNDRWERVPLSPPSESRGIPLPTGREIVQWDGAGPALAYHPTEHRWREIRLPKTPWREFASVIWTGTELIAWGGDSCPATAKCVALRPVEDGIALTL